MSVSRETLIAGTPDVSRETSDRLLVFERLLLKWNARINLISRTDESALWQRHIDDSLQLMDLVPAGTDRAVDLGSGAGFPGLVLAIATGIPFDLIEADQRKCAFLREVAREAGAPVTIHAMRIEHAVVPAAPLVTARALAPLPELLSLACRFMTPASVALFPKGARVEEELTASVPGWNMVIERHASRIDPRGVILRLSEVHPV